nr:calcium-binding protein 8-like [Oncorhynchus nerka]
MCDLCREKMPFHHVRSTLLYTGSLLSRTLSEGSETFQLTSISTEELGEIREAFRVLDRDGNGFISKQELGMAMRSLGYMPSEVELAIIMQRLDMDGDGQVDFEEFVTILGPKLLSSETREGFLGSTIDNIFWQSARPRRGETAARRCSPIPAARPRAPSSARGPRRRRALPRASVRVPAAIDADPTRPLRVAHRPRSGDPRMPLSAPRTQQPPLLSSHLFSYSVHPKKKNRQTCVRKSLICAFAMAFIISVMLIAANQMLRNGME